MYLVLSQNIALCLVPARFEPYESLFVSLVRYTLPALNGMTRTNLKEMESHKARELLLSLELTKCKSTSGAFAEIHAKTPGVMHLQQALRVPL